MDIVACSETKEDWMQVTGKRKTGKWAETSWIKNKGISFEEKDIAVALYMNRAGKIADKKEKLEALNKIMENPDLQGSVFATELEAMINELSNPENPIQIDEGDSTDFTD
jgi:hypothetical protein